LSVGCLNMWRHLKKNNWSNFNQLKNT
jgi:hypothetical protein